MDCSPRNRKTAARGPEVQEGYYTLINISSRIRKRGGKSNYGAIDYKKAHDMVPQSWIIDCFKMYKIFGEVIKFVKNTMENWRVELTAREKALTEVEIQRGIF